MAGFSADSERRSSSAVAGGAGAGFARRGLVGRRGQLDARALQDLVHLVLLVERNQKTIS